MSEKESRRQFLGKIGGFLIGLGLFGQLAAYVRSLIPNVLYEPPKKFKIGFPENFSEGVKFIEDRRLYIFRERDQMYAISAVCTHLGCTVKHAPFSKPKEVTVRGEEKPCVVNSAVPATVRCFTETAPITTDRRPNRWPGTRWK